MDFVVVDNWIKLYIMAWQRPGEQDLKDVFSEDATYRFSPFKKPLRSRAAIADFWEHSREPGEAFTVEYDIVATEGDIAVVKVDVLYTKPLKQHWKDIWIFQLDDDGICFAFEEWPFSPDHPDGHPAK